jgi:benzoate/toluate 1,2-dioxygenase beta subunit
MSRAAMSVDFALRDRIEAFVNNEAALLDGQRYEDWLKLYAPDAYYWVPHRPGQTSWRDEISIFFDDRMLLETRVRRLSAATAHAETPRARTLRVVGRVAAEPGMEAGIAYFATARFVMIEYRANAQRTYAGTYRHALRADGGDFLIAWKRVDLVNAEATQEPISIPF